MILPAAVFRNERDVEVPLFLDFLERHKPQSLVDVGAFYTHATYARAARKLIPGTYIGVDPRICDKTEEIVDGWGNYEYSRETRLFLECVSCISTLEHVGAESSVAAERESQQLSLATAILNDARKCAFLSFPFGREGWVKDSYSNITVELLARILLEAERRGFTTSATFYRSSTPTDGGWEEIDSETASLEPFDLPSAPGFVGCHCVCILGCWK